MKKPHLLIGSPELIVDLPEGMGNLSGRILNFKTGGMADINSTIVKYLAKDGDIDLSVVIPKWKSSLSEITQLTKKEIDDMNSYLQDHNFYLIEDSSFNRVRIKGSNTMIYDDTHRFSSEDRAIAFNRAIINWVLPNVKPDVAWFSDWMLGLSAASARKKGTKVLSTGHNIFTKYLNLDDIIKSGIDTREFSEWIYYGSGPNKGKVDLFTTEIFASDYWTTVSPTFLEEICNGTHDRRIIPEVAAEIRNKYYAGRASGILNPRQEEYSSFLEDIAHEGMDATIQKRKRNAKDLRRRIGLKNYNGPIVIFPNRLFSGQKKPELALDYAKGLSETYGVQFLFLANGDKNLEKRAREISGSSNGMIAYSHFNSSFEDLALASDRVYGLMTSEYEPCGKPNIVYPGEGILIIGHNVGGIADSTHELNWKVDDNELVSVQGEGFPYEFNDLGGLAYSFCRMKEFDELPDSLRYSILKSVAEQNIIEHGAKNRIKDYKEIIFQLYEEKISEN